MTRLGEGREVFGGSEEKGEEARVKVKSQRSEKWRGVEFIDGETAPVQGSPLSNLVLLSTQQTMDLLGPNHVCLMNQTIRNVGTKFCVGSVPTPLRWPKSV